MGLTSTQGVEINQEHCTERIRARVEANQQFGKLEGRAPAAATSEELEMAKDGEEERTILRASIRESAQARVDAEDRVEGALETKESTLDKLCGHRHIALVFEHL